jgi:hypothetical protein
MKHLVHNIVHNPMPPLPTQFTRELRMLVQAMLAKRHSERPSINSVLSMSVFRDKISDILGDHIKQVGC